MNPLSMPECRKIVKSVLAKHGKSNKFSLRSTNFECHRHNNFYTAIEIKDWTPDPLAQQIEEEIKAEGEKEQTPFLVTFAGSGFVSA